jgi:hypothetical protein
MPVPHIGLMEPLRFELPDETLYCPACDRSFRHRTRAGVERLFAEHLAELRDPTGHTPEPF